MTGSRIQKCFSSSCIVPSNIADHLLPLSHNKMFFHTDTEDSTTQMYENQVPTSMCCSLTMVSQFLRGPRLSSAEDTGDDQRDLSLSSALSGKS